ncbi:hypothetical protein ILUMI_14593 [Ignelater luminosus]|uniref:Uncharacterized protein n=1 Tax=Ignelater luminosus TaxID=2038154 RepID=A0A8K0CYC0_IGNLU|nr:hypothetical protein ILUMI_14593 [Ignelater luminosus]
MYTADVLSCFCLKQQVPEDPDVCDVVHCLEAKYSITQNRSADIKAKTNSKALSRTQRNSIITTHYLRNHIQHELISVLGSKVKAEIVNLLKSSKYYVIILDCVPAIGVIDAENYVVEITPYLNLFATVLKEYRKHLENQEYRQKEQTYQHRRNVPPFQPGD